MKRIWSAAVAVCLFGIPCVANAQGTPIPTAKVEGYEITLTSLEVSAVDEAYEVPKGMDPVTYLMFKEISTPGGGKEIVDLTPSVTFSYRIACRDEDASFRLFGIEGIKLRDEEGHVLTRKKDFSLRPDLSEVGYALVPEYSNPGGNASVCPLSYDSQSNTLTFPLGDLKQAASFTGTVVQYERMEKEVLLLNDLSGAVVRKKVGDFEAAVKGTVQTAGQVKELAITVEASDTSPGERSSSDFISGVRVMQAGKTVPVLNVGASRAGKKFNQHFELVIPPGVDPGGLSVQVTLVHRSNPVKKTPFEIKIAK
jgi:hypothetical protein